MNARAIPTRLIVSGLQVLVVAVPLIFTSTIHEYGTPKLIFAEVLIVALASLWLLGMVLDGKVAIVDTPLHLMLLGLLAVGLASLFWARNIDQGLDIFFRQVCFFLLAVLVLHTVRSSDHIKKITGAMALTGGVVALIGMLQYNEIYSIGSPRYLPISTIGNVNFVAQYYNAIFPIAIAVFFVARRLWARVGIGVACFAMACHLMILGSRGGWLGAVFSLSLLAGVAWLRRFLTERRVADFVIPLVIIACVKWVVDFGQSGAPALERDHQVKHLIAKHWMGMRNRSEDAIRLADYSSFQRVNLWIDTIDLIFDRPFLGVGLGNYEFSIPKFMSRESLVVKDQMEKMNERDLMAFTVHNEYLEVWAETGLIGLLIFGVLLLQIGWILVDLVRRYLRGEMSFLPVGFAASFLATLTHAFFSSNFQQPASAMHFWIAVGLVWSLHLNVQRQTPVRLFAIASRKVAVGMVVLSGAILIFALAMSTRTIAGEVYYQRGRQALQQKKYAVAEAWYREAAAHRPTRYYRTRQALGTVLYNREKWDEAIEVFRQSLIDFPDNARVHHLLGQALAKTGHDSAAVVHAQRAVALNPMKAEFHTGLGEVFLHFGRSAEAIEVAERALALDPTDVASLHLSGRLHAKAGNLEEAKRSYRRALQISSDDAAVLNSLAVVYAKQGNFEGARDILDHALSKAPDNTDYLFNYAVVQIGRGDYQGALKTLEQVLSQVPDYARAYQVRGEVLSKLGREDAAQQEKEKAWQLAPNDPQLMQILKEME